MKQGKNMVLADLQRKLKGLSERQKLSRERVQKTSLLVKDLRWLKAQDPIFKDVSIHDLIPDRPTMEIVEQIDTFEITTQAKKVNDEKHMISNESIIVASISNKVDKAVKRVKEMFHKKPPLATTLTKRTELENRNLVANISSGIFNTAIIGLIIYLILRGK